MDIDQQGNIWFAGWGGAINSSLAIDFPTTPDAAISTPPSPLGGCVLFCLSRDLSTLIYSSFLPDSIRFIHSLKFNHDGNIVISGQGEPPANIISVGAISDKSLLPYNVTPSFLAIINRQSKNWIHASYTIADTGINHIYYSFVASSLPENRFVTSLAIGCDNEVYLTGSFDFRKFNGWTNDSSGFYSISVFSPDLSVIQASTRFGNLQTEVNYCKTLAVDGCGNVYLHFENETLETQANHLPLPLTPNAIDTVAGNSWLGVFGRNLEFLKLGTYIWTNQVSSWISSISSTGVLYNGFVSDTSWQYMPSWAHRSTPFLSASANAIIYKLQLNAFPVRTLVVSGGGAGAAHPHAVKNCSEARIDFIKNSYDKDSITVHYEIVGDAVSGIDYQPLPDSLIFSANDSFQSLIIKPLSNATGGRKVIVNTIAPCQCDQVIISSDTIWIYDTLQVSILEPEAVCEGDTLTLQGVFDSVLTAVWQPESMILASSSDGSAISTVPYQTTTYTLTVSFPDVITCPPATAEVTVNTHPYPQTNLPDTLKVCEGDTLHIAMDVTPPGLDLTYYWSPNTHLRHDSSGNNYFYAPEGSYDYILTVINSAAGCQIDENLVVIVHPEFHLLSVDPEDTLVEYGTSLRLTAMGLAERWQWIPTHYLDNPAINNPTSVPISDIVYYVIGYDANNCTDTGEVRIRIDFNSNVFVPTAFSPNGDGVNDVFKPYHIRYEEIDAFLVYNRFGELVFSTTNPDEGWDGKHKGTEADIGVYYWYLRLKLPDGSVNEQMGDVSLLK